MWSRVTGQVASGSWTTNCKSEGNAFLRNIWLHLPAKQLHFPEGQSRQWHSYEDFKTRRIRCTVFKSLWRGTGNMFQRLLQRKNETVWKTDHLDDYQLFIRKCIPVVSLRKCSQHHELESNDGVRKDVPFIKEHSTSVAGSVNVDRNQKYCAWLLYVACLLSPKALSVLVHNKNIL